MRAQESVSDLVGERQPALQDNMATACLEVYSRGREEEERASLESGRAAAGRLVGEWMRFHR